MDGFGFRVLGGWFRVSGCGFRVSGFGFRVSGLRFRISGFGFQVSGFGFRVSGSGFRVSGFGFSGFGRMVEGQTLAHFYRVNRLSSSRQAGFAVQICQLRSGKETLALRVSGLGFRVSGFGFRMVSGFRFRVSGFGFRVWRVDLGALLALGGESNANVDVFELQHLHLTREREGGRVSE